MLTQSRRQIPLAVCGRTLANDMPRDPLCLESEHVEPVSLNGWLTSAQMLCSSTNAKAFQPSLQLESWLSHSTHSSSLKDTSCLRRETTLLRAACSGKNKNRTVPACVVQSTDDGVCSCVAKRGCPLHVCLKPVYTAAISWCCICCALHKEAVPTSALLTAVIPVIQPRFFISSSVLELQQTVTTFHKLSRSVTESVGLIRWDVLGRENLCSHTRHVSFATATCSPRDGSRDKGGFFSERRQNMREG